MENEVLQKLSTLLSLLRQTPDFTSRQVIALNSEFGFEPLECFGSVNPKDNAIFNQKHSKPVHITGVVNCKQTHILVGDVTKLSSNKDYLDSFVTVAVEHRLLNIFPA